MNGPITPAKVRELRVNIIPEEIFEAFNECILKYWDGSEAAFSLAEVSILAASKLDDGIGNLFKKKYFDVEEIYEKEGWKVIFERPGYNEPGEAMFYFSEKA